MSCLCVYGRIVTVDGQPPDMRNVLVGVNEGTGISFNFSTLNSSRGC